VPFTRYHVLRVQERPWQERVAAWNATRVPSLTSPTTA
jgi:hypothetical protein